REQAAPDEYRLPRPRPEPSERPLEDLRMRLPLPDLRRKNREVDPVRDPHLLEVTPQQPARIERVRDEPQLEAARAKGLEHGVRGSSEHARGRPRLVLGLEEAPELLVGDLDLEMGEQLADEARILDLLGR